MSRSHLVRTVLAVVALGASLPGSAALAEPGDSTWVHTWEEDFFNWATPHDQVFTFPDGTTNYSSITMYYTIACPEAPADCDPWDRLGWVQLLHDTGEVDGEGEPILEPYEIARIVTPYDITGGTRPGSCTWEIDVTDYKMLLQGDVLLRSYIESWIGDERGWLVTIDFAFVEGDRFLEPYQVVNLWQNNRIVYGDPAQDPEAVLVPREVPIDARTQAAKLRVVNTGHGQGNTNNCAEFCNKEHTFVANGDVFTEFIWRGDCSANPCSPQGGTWQGPRAGWCPGDAVTPLDLDVSASIVAGATATLDYDLQEYENFCRPTNPDCVSGVTCVDCNYNFTGHTEPHYSIQAQLILYEEGDLIGVDDPDAASLARSITLGQNTPNPFNPLTRIPYSLAEAGSITLVITDAGGRIVREITRHHDAPGDHHVRWDGRDARGQAVPSGVYFYELQGRGTRAARKMILLK